MTCKHRKKSETMKPFLQKHFRLQHSRQSKKFKNTCWRICLLDRGVDIVWGERGTSLPHFRSKTEGEHVVPTVSIDYFFMGPSGQEEAQGVLPMLAVKSHESRMTFAHVVERKGLVDSTTRRLVVDLDWLGWDCEDWCSNQVKNRRFWLSSRRFESRCPQLNFVMEESPVEEQQSNGTVEVIVREIQKQVRVMKSSLEERMKCEVLSRHPILAFLVEHAGKLMSRYQVGRDGRTAYELRVGKPYRKQLVEFGEREYFMPIRPGDARQVKLDPKWQDEAFIGFRDRSDEMLIMTTSGECTRRGMFGDAQSWSVGILHSSWRWVVRRGTRIRRRERWQLTHFPQTWQFRCQHQHQFRRSWWRLHRWIVQRAECTSRRLMCRNSDTAWIVLVADQWWRTRRHVRTLKNVARDWKVVWPRMRRRNSDRKQQNFALVIGWPVELDPLRNQGVVTLCHTSRVERRAARHRRQRQVVQCRWPYQAVQRMNDSEVTKFQIMVSREWDGHFMNKKRKSLIQVNRVFKFRVKNTIEGWNDNQIRRRKIWRTQMIKKIVEMPTMMTWKHWEQLTRNPW